MKYKNLTKEQILISLDRLTRFKYTKDKYLRVYTDILTSCLIDPKFKKTDIEKLDFVKLTKLVEGIFNSSVLSFVNSCNNNDYSINTFLQNYENTVFINNSEIQELLNNKFDYKSAISLIPNDCPINLKWLKIISTEQSDFKNLREKYSLKYPIEKLILAEGITEEILLPKFAEFLGEDFNKSGIHVIPAGGKNQVVKMYYKLIAEVKLPIFVLLDKDAEENINQIKPKLRKIDKIHLVSCGEFEDLLPTKLIVKTVNKHFENFLTISEQDLIAETPTAKKLEEIFKTKGLHEFKKAEFSKLVSENINDESDVSEEIRKIIKELKGV